MHSAKAFKLFVLQVGALPEAELAERVRVDRCDVLVELTGHTAGNRLGVLAMRPAPVQVLWGPCVLRGLKYTHFCQVIPYEYCCPSHGDCSGDCCSPAAIGQ